MSWLDWARVGLCLLLLAGCADSEDADVDSLYDEAISKISVEWSPCQWSLAQCAATDMPLYWDRSGGTQINVSAKRRLSRTADTSAQIWLVDGGPGSPGTENLTWLFHYIQDVDPSLELLTLDHRGTGNSSKLECPLEDEEDDSMACVEHVKSVYGSDLAAYSTTNAAVDLAAYIDASTLPGVPVYVWGFSYGTYLSHRFLQIFPEMVDGVILEGIAPPDNTFIPGTYHANQVAREFFSLCADDDFCASKMGDDPWRALDDTFRRITDEQHCSELNKSEEFFRDFVAQLLYTRPIADTIPALIHRLNRCNEADVAAWEHLFDLLGVREDGSLEMDPGFSIMLYANVVYSEMWEHPDWPTEEHMQSYIAEHQAGDVVRRWGLEDMLDLWVAWPKYDDDQFDDEWAQTDTPLLMLQGQLDPATHMSRAIGMKDHFDAAHQTFVSFPYGAHALIVGTEFNGGGELSCGLALAMDFVDDPQRTLDTTCATLTLPHDFAGTNVDATFLLGADDIWDVDPTGISTLELPPTLPEQSWRLKAAVERLRSRVQRAR